jgi:hypothetical protein
VNSLHEEWNEEDRFTPGFLKTIQVSGSEKQKLSPERIQLIRKYLEQVYQMVGSLLLVQYEQYHRDHHIDGGGQNVVQDNETTSRIVLDCQMFTLMMQLEFAKSFATCSLKRSQELVGLLFQQMEILLERQPQVFIQHVLQDPLGYNNHHQLATKKNIEFQDDFLIGIGLLELDRMIQRRLRTILHHPTAATELFEASLGVIFLGVFHSYKPLDSFVHRFLSFCINNLPRLMVAFPTLKGKINNQRILPYYMELLLINYPTRVSKETVPRVLSVILGALFYNTSSSHTSLQVWVMKRLGQRAIELLKLPKRLDLEMLVAKKKEQEEVEQTNGNIETSKKSAKAINTVNEDGLFLLTLVFEILKIVPLDHGDHLLVASAKEVERMIHLLREWTTNENKSELFKIVCDRLYSMISTNCDADRRAWLASWYLDLVNIYDLSISSKHKNSHMSKL